MSLCHRACFPLVAIFMLGCSRADDVQPQLPAKPADESRGQQDRPGDAGNGNETERSGGKHVDAAPASSGVPGERKFALLVGVTKYDRLTNKDLVGPGNDVILMRKTLKDRFKFNDKNIVTLADASQAAGRPTRANIKKQFDRLADIAKPGDQMIILLAGHGSQQPELVPFSETDGLDEIFLPCDAGPWDGSKQMVTNAVIDDELEVWTKAIIEKGASLFVIVDSCHSGTMLRGGEEVAREIPEGELVPIDVLKKAREKAAARNEAARGGDAKPPSVKKASRPARLVGLYAAQRNEPTFELRLPRDSGNATRHGLLTYAVCDVVTRAKTPLTYLELAKQVHAKYVQWNAGSLWPTPMIEGDGLDDEILGKHSWPGRSRFTLQRTEEGWKIQAGLLHGLTDGSVLAVYPAAGSADANKVVGHVRIGKSQITESEAEPCAYGKTQVVKDLPDGGRCEPVYINFGLLRLKVGIEGVGKDEKDEHRRMRDILKTIAKDADSPIQYVEDLNRADVVARVQADQVWLMIADVAQLKGTPPLAAAHFGPFALNQSHTIREKLTRMARVRNLLRIASDPASSAGTDLKLDMVRLKNKTDAAGETIVWGSQGLVFKPGDLFAWRVTNQSQSPVDVTFLFVSSDFGIKAIFPNPRTATSGDNRILPNATALLARGNIDAKPVGREYMVVIAVKGAGPPIDFTCLSQPTLELWRSTPRGTGKSALESQLGKLMTTAMFSQGSTRGYNVLEMENQLLTVFSWTVASSKGEPSK